MPTRTENEMPLCPVHQRLDETEGLILTYGNGCVACSLAEREELLEILEPFAAGDSVSSLRELVEENARLNAELAAYRAIGPQIQIITWLDGSCLEIYEGKIELYDQEGSPLPGQYDSLPEAFQAIQEQQ